MTEAERIVATAIERDGVVHQGGREGHWRIRAELGDAEPSRSNLTDTEGFVTDAGRFVGRREANRIAAEAGQCPLYIGRDMLSSDLIWDAKPPPKKRADGHVSPHRKRIFRA